MSPVSVPLSDHTCFRARFHLVTNGLKKRVPSLSLGRNPQSNIARANGRRNADNQGRSPVPGEYPATLETSLVAITAPTWTTGIRRVFRFGNGPPSGLREANCAVGVSGMAIT